MDNQTLFLEKKIISKTNRFQLNPKELKEIKNTFKNSNVLLLGAAGSIGKECTKKILKFNCNKVFLIDKNENELTELNRFFTKNRKVIKKIDFICSDINNLNLSKFIKKHKINYFLNLAAVKHVRSEENIYSIKYMLNTNCINCFNFTPNKELKKIFIVSTDKASDPSSIMGLTKKIMEYKLIKKFKKNKKVDFSTIRFGNVSFSNGGILKLMVDCINQRKNFSIPLNIKRYFITHDEAATLCLRALLKNNRNKVLIPKEKKIGNQKNIFVLLCQILRIIGVKFIRKKNKIKTKYFIISLINTKIRGQKNEERFLGENEKIGYIKNEKFLNYVKHSKNFDFLKLINLIKNSESIEKIINKTFNIKKLGKKISHTI